MTTSAILTTSTIMMTIITTSIMTDLIMTVLIITTSITTLGATTIGLTRDRAYGRSRVPLGVSAEARHRAARSDTSRCEMPPVRHVAVTIDPHVPHVDAFDIHADPGRTAADLPSDVMTWSSR
jgi:hypothetical protein